MGFLVDTGSDNMYNVGNMMLSVSEIFYSIQGEGRDAGLPMVFLRLSGCNLKCPQCDTAYALDVEHGTQFFPSDVAKSIQSYHAPMLAVTGGEPFLQAKSLCELVGHLLDGRGTLRQVCFETNGTIEPRYSYPLELLKKLLSRNLLRTVTVSPKGEAMGVMRDWAIEDDWLGAVPVSVLQFKYVVNSWDQIAEICHHLLSVAAPVDVCFQPLRQGGEFVFPQCWRDWRTLSTTYPDHWAVLHKLMAKSVVRFLPQLHGMVWGQEEKE